MARSITTRERPHAPRERPQKKRGRIPVKVEIQESAISRDVLFGKMGCDSTWLEKVDEMPQVGGDFAPRHDAEAVGHACGSSKQSSQN